MASKGLRCLVDLSDVGAGFVYCTVEFRYGQSDGLRSLLVAFTPKPRRVEWWRPCVFLADPKDLHAGLAEISQFWLLQAFSDEMDIYEIVEAFVLAPLRGRSRHPMDLVGDVVP